MAKLIKENDKVLRYTNGTTIFIVVRHITNFSYTGTYDITLTTTSGDIVLGFNSTFERNEAKKLVLRSI